jgi:WD40 repeat protein
MKLLHLILLFIPWIAASPLHGQYPEFNVGEKIGDDFVLSPHGKFLAQTNCNSRTLKLWDTQTGKLHSTSTLDARYGKLFFSSDSTKLFRTQDNIMNNDLLHNDLLHQYNITEEGLFPINPIILHKESKFSKYSNNSSYAYITNEEGTEFKKLNTESSCKQTLSCFLTTMLPDGTEKNLELSSPIISLGYTTCSLSPDAQLMVAVCQKYPSEYIYIHIIDLESLKLMHNYRFSRSSSVESIHFSPNKTKLVRLASFVIEGINYFNYWLDVIDLKTNQSSRFKQEKQAQYAAFVDDTTIMTVLKDGSVSYHEITPENLEQHRINDKSYFKVLTDDPCDW